MAHEIEVHGDGRAAFVSARQDAWHRLGTVLDHQFTAAEAMEHALLGGWNVRKTPLTTTEVTEDGVTSIEVPGKYATVRTNPVTGAMEALGVVGEKYVPVQNEETAEFLDALVDNTGGHLETAGSLRGGQQVFVTCRLPEAMMVGGKDQVDMYLAVLNSHDGNSGFRAIVTPVRIVCANTQHAALREARQSWTIRHMAGAKAAIEEARQSLELSWKFAQQFEAEAERMIQETLAEAEFERMLARLFGEVDPEKSAAKQRRKIQRLDTIRYLYYEADTQAEIRGTRWAGYQAVVEYLDHYIPVRGDDEAEAVLRRANRSLSTEVVAKKNDAFRLLRVPA